MISTIVIGSGYTGAACGFKLLGGSEAPASATLVEREAARGIGGLAYSSVTAAAFDQMNVAARTLSPLASSPTELLTTLNVAPGKIMPRRLMGEFLQAKLDRTAAENVARGIAFAQYTGNIVDLHEDADGVTLHTADSQILRADTVIVATGNLQQRTLPACHQKIGEPTFDAHFISDQFLPESRARMAAIPADAPVMILGTALSGFDAARALLRQNHTGKIMMASRHGLEHFQYPTEINWPDLTLPKPRFMDAVRQGDTDKAVAEMLAEFRELTGIDVDLETHAIKGESWLKTHFAERAFPLPEQVLKQWEKHIPEIASLIGVDKFGDVIRQYSSLIGVLRIGVGHEICEELKEARARGQLQTIATDISEICPDEDGMTVTLQRRRASDPEKIRVHTVISSLGPDYDYAKIEDPLWRNIITKGYTTPHKVGIGVDISTGADDFGRLPGSQRIFAAGIPAAGAYIVTQGVIGPLATAIPGMRALVERTADCVVARNNRSRHALKPA